MQQSENRGTIILNAIVWPLLVISTAVLVFMADISFVTAQNEYGSFNEQATKLVRQ